jgi:uncharacterized membrane protein
MSSRWQWLLLHFSRRLWVRAALISLLAVAAVLLAAFANPFIPPELPARIGAGAVDHILGILASSMLAVTTFSLSVMVSAYGAATTNVTPRATPLLREDATSQNVLATFIGAFMFSLVGIVALSTGAFGERGRVVLLVATIAVIVLIVVALLRWIEHLSVLGRVGYTTDRVERAASAAMKARVAQPCLGARRLADPRRDIPAGARPLCADRIGYVQHIDVGALSRCAEAQGGEVFVLVLPGSFVDPTRPLARLAGIDGDEAEAAMRAAFTIDDARSFDQDPRFGLVVLAEIASRALSPAVNDPGTAIDVIGRAVRVLALWQEAGEEAAGEAQPACAHVWLPPLCEGELFDDVFMAIGRDGAGMLEVQLRVQKALVALFRLGGKRFRVHALRHSRLALARAEAALALEYERALVREAATAVGGEAGPSARPPAA